MNETPDAPIPEPVPTTASQNDASVGTEGQAQADGGEFFGPPLPPGKRRRRRRRRRGKGAAEGGSDGDAPAATEAVSAASGARGDGAASAVTAGAKGRRAAKKSAKAPRDTASRSRGKKAPKTEHHALQAMRELSQMARSLLEVEGFDPLSVPRYLELKLRIPLDQADARSAAGVAVEQILQRVREVREHEAALRPGAVFCYFSSSAEVEQSRPAEPRQVFEGYNSTGRPVFSDFVTMAIERKDKGIDQLLAGEDVVLTHVTMGRVLRTQQLAEFGSDSAVFKILGQVDAGLFRVLGAEQKCAFSFQLLRGSTLEGKPRLRLHSVGKVDLMDLADPHILNILSRFQRRLDAESLRLEGRENNGETDDEAFVLPLLQDLAQKLAGRVRSTGRRTQHAQSRSEDRQRPTPKAYPDAGEAADSAILWDVEKNTIVVSGPKGRVHVFTPLARHVTSVMMQGSAVERRRQQGRWRLAEPEERGEFRIQLRQLVASGKAETADDPDVPPEV